MLGSVNMTLLSLSRRPEGKNLPPLNEGRDPYLKQSHCKKKEIQKLKEKNVDPKWNSLEIIDIYP